MYVIFININTEYVLIQAHALIDAHAPAAKTHITSNSHQMPDKISKDHPKD